MESGISSKVKEMFLTDNLYFTVTDCLMSQSCLNILIWYLFLNESQGLGLDSRPILSSWSSFMESGMPSKCQLNVPDRSPLFHIDKLLNVTEMAEYFERKPSMIFNVLALLLIHLEFLISIHGVGNLLQSQRNVTERWPSLHINNVEYFRAGWIFWHKTFFK